MSPEIVKQQIEEIKMQSHDAEVAHSIEDHLYFSIIASISQDLCENPKECCKIALESWDIDFPRWCS